MSKAIAIGFFILAILAGAFRATHHPVYSNCYYNEVGDRVCELIKWEGNK